MRRRELLASVAVFLPSVGLAQQPKVPVIGILVPGKSADVSVGALQQAMRDLGYIEGRNIRFEIRSAEDDLARLPALAAELVRERVDIIAPWSTPAALAAKQATSDIPIVMLAVGDPVASGIVPSLAHPGGNITGMSAFGAETSAKLLEFLIEAVPKLHRIGAIFNAADPFHEQQIGQVEAAAKLHHIEVVQFLIRAGPELDAALAALTDKNVQAVIVQPTLPLKSVADRALALRLPAASAANVFTLEGGLMSFAPDPERLFQSAATIADKILKGAKPADIPIEQPTYFKLMINLKTAKAIGSNIPPSLLDRADEVIE
jgi:putative ABC transport system substrate-binding protein